MDQDSLSQVRPDPDQILTYACIDRLEEFMVLGWRGVRDDTGDVLGLRRSTSEESWKRLFWYVLAGSRGGPNRGRIINLLRREPYNINRLSEALGVHYRVAEHHIRMLERNRLVSSAGERYGKLYFLSPEMEAHLQLFDEIWQKIQPRKPLGVE